MTMRREAMSNPWWEQPVLVFDTETTGKDPETARIVTACTAVLEPDGNVTDAYNVLINPGIEIDPKATEVHGITNEQAAEGEIPFFALHNIVTYLTSAAEQGMPIVAYNARYDFTVLDRDCRRNNCFSLSHFLPDGIGPVLDPYILDKAADTYRKGSRKLKDTCSNYGVNLTEWHTADADAIAAGRLARALIRAHRMLQTPTAYILHTAQQMWAYDQAASLESYLRRKHQDPDIVCARSWPLVPASEAMPL